MYSEISAQQNRNNNLSVQPVVEMSTYNIHTSCYLLFEAFDGTVNQFLPHHFKGYLKC